MVRRTSIDFRPARGSEKTALVYTALKHGNSSQMILSAYRAYRPSEPEAVTAMIDMDTQVQAFVDMYNIRERNDIIETVRKEPFNRDIDFVEPSEKNISFPEDDPDARQLIATLEQVRYRDRGAIVVRIVHQYLAAGNSEYYNKMTAGLLFNWIKEELAEPDELRDPAVNGMIDRIAAAVEEKAMWPEGKPKSSISDDEFRKLIGAI